MMERASHPLSGVSPGQIAVLGTWGQEPPSKVRVVRVLGWPEIPQAWARLAEGVLSVRTLLQARGGEAGASWMARVAPQLCGFARDSDGAAEATIGALIQRLPIRFTVAMAETPRQGNPSAVGIQCRSLFGDCLSPYAEHLKQTNQSAKEFIVAADVQAERRTVQQMAYKHVRPTLRFGERLERMELLHWPSQPLPAPVELAQLVAGVVGRYLEDAHQAGPLWEAVLAKLVNPPRGMRGYRIKRRK